MTINNQGYIIYRKNMTIKYINSIDDFILNRKHRLPCNCWLCLWRKYRECSSLQGGRKYDVLIFLVSDLIQDVKLAYLIEKGIAKKIIKQGAEGWEFPFGAKYKTPYVHETKKILRQLPEFGEITIQYLSWYAYQIFPAYAQRKRYTRSTFLKLCNELEFEITSEWRERNPISPKKKLEHKQNWDDIKLAQKTAMYINAQPGKAVKRRDLQRHFNLKIEDLKRINTFLLGNYGIRTRREGYRNKTVIYYSTSNKAGGKYWSIGPLQ